MTGCEVRAYHALEAIRALDAIQRPELAREGYIYIYEGMLLLQGRPEMRMDQPSTEQTARQCWAARERTAYVDE
jgi:hypothetical protein